MSNVVKLDAFVIDYVKANNNHFNNSCKTTFRIFEKSETKKSPPTVQRYISKHLAVYLTQAIPISKVQRYIKAHHVTSSVPIQQRNKITDNDKAA